jgi:hypothetical protein
MWRGGDLQPILEEIFLNIPMGESPANHFYVIIAFSFRKYANFIFQPPGGFIQILSSRTNAQIFFKSLFLQ